ncbi:MAG: hypothetical protein GC181_08570 [Bacteroidetes bacterium]|nr:hypothetical protein [Bacteroidota bacterium]
MQRMKHPVVLYFILFIGCKTTSMRNLRDFEELKLKIAGDIRIPCDSTDIIYIKQPGKRIDFYGSEKAWNRRCDFQWWVMPYVEIIDSNHSNPIYLDTFRSNPRIMRNHQAETDSFIHYIDSVVTFEFYSSYGIAITNRKFICYNCFYDMEKENSNCVSMLYKHKHGEWILIKLEKEP